jgi:hypothetical protein
MVVRNALVLAVVLATAGCAEMMSGPQTNPPSAPEGTTVSRSPETVDPADPGTIPVGQELDVRLQDTLSSDTAEVEQRFDSTTVVDLRQGSRVLVPAGSMVRGVISGVDQAGRLDRTGRLTLSFDRLSIDGREVPMRATATRVFESGGLRDEAKTAGVGAGVGGIVGGIIGGLEGALLGAVIGAGGAVVATEGKDVTLPAGTIIRIRMDTPVRVTR